jgi:hypothetical protein
MDGDSLTGCKHTPCPARRLRFSLLGLLYFAALVAVVITILTKWTTVAPLLRGKSAPIHLIYLGSWQLILASSAIVIMGVCIVELYRQPVAPPRPRVATAAWILLTTCFGFAAAIDWYNTHATGSELLTELGTSVFALLFLCGLFCLYHARNAWLRSR